MPELRKDVIRGHWVSFASDRALKPSDFPTAQKSRTEEKKNGFCPFCEGYEQNTPPEVDSCRPDDTLPNTPGWKIRVIPNKFSAFDPSLELSPRKNGICPVMNGVGVHEVIVETPEHERGWQDYTAEEIYQLLQIYQRRFQALEKDDRIRSIQIYKNYGFYAGASLAHNHSQLIGFPFVPAALRGVVSYHQETGRCVLCDLMKQELEEKTRILYEGTYFVLLCPYASRFSYETWLVPKTHRPHFKELPEAEIREMAEILHRYLPKMLNVLGDPSYNLVINAGPVNVETDSKEPCFHWYMEILPRMMIQAGVEVASGVYMNPVTPEYAAEILREGCK